uniref:kunitz trypsin inhibitor 4-like n=1 Tax=Erigeron canadensis TaxID=72917 RepID=UPI001CB8E926|nr:kunitz trypsin inhibitor 4-like [Erigeron canadensis]
MKKTYTFIFLNLLIFTTTLSHFTSGSGIIYDSAGNKLLRGIPYYILPLLRGSGGGLTLTRTTKDGCPLNVTQEPFEFNNGVPFTFNPIVLEEEIIRGAYPISIESDVSNPCHASNILKVTTVKTRMKKDSKHLVNENYNNNHSYDHKKKKDDDDDDDSKYVTIQIVTNGGEYNKPESCFQFVENDLMPGLISYQIQHCPFKCGSSSSSSSPGFSCYNVGIIKDVDGTGYLGHTDEIFPVAFTNAYGSYGKSDNKDVFSPSAKMSTFSQFMAKVSTFSDIRLNY